MSRNVSFADGDDYDAAAGGGGGFPSSPPSDKNRPPSGPPKICCPNCGSTQIESHGPSGASVCTDCATVVEENAIVSSVEFVEGAGGASSAVGQFVSETSSKAFGSAGGGGRGGRYGYSCDSRESTLANGRRRIQDVAARLRLGSHYVDAAYRLFTIAVQRNFIQGRRTAHVVATTLYVACRQEKSPHMLIDFSDALQINVYVLGACFLKFRRELRLRVDVVDPALYVYRFAAHLDLDDRAKAVEHTALRLIKRMNRDWIVAGRRPAGICAAALLIAARAHGFTRNNQDVTKVLRVCGVTVSNRLKEFEATPSANLTLEQFHEVDVETEADPPIFTSNRIKEARALAIQQNDVELLESGALDDPRAGARGKKWREGRCGVGVKTKELNTLYGSLEEEMTREAEELKYLKENADDDGDDDGGPRPDEAKEGGAPTKAGKNRAENGGDGNGTLVPRGSIEPPSSSSRYAYPKRQDGRSIVLHHQATEEELLPPAVPAEAKLCLDEWKGDMPSDAADEIEGLFRNDEEVAVKEAVFNAMNGEYIANQERKDGERKAAEEAEKEKEEDEAAQEERRARYLKSNRGRKRRKGGGGGEAEEDEPTTEEALLAAIQSRRISRKINYDAMSTVFDDEGTFATDLLDDGDVDAGGFEM